MKSNLKHMWGGVICTLLLFLGFNLSAQQRFIYPHLYKSGGTGPTITTPFSSIDYTEASPLTLSGGGYGISDERFAKNAFYDVYGEPIFYVVGAMVLDKNGAVIGQMFNRTSVDEPVRSDFKTVVIPIPGQEEKCIKRYYIITLSRGISTNSNPNNSLKIRDVAQPFFSILNLGETNPNANFNVISYLEDVDGPAGTAKSLPIATQQPGFMQPFADVIERNNVSMNAVKKRNTDEYILVVTHQQIISVYDVTASGITLVTQGSTPPFYNSFVDVNFPGLNLPNTGDIYESPGSDQSAELEIVELPNVNYRMSYAVTPSGTGINFPTPHAMVSILDIDENLKIISTSKKWTADIYTAPDGISQIVTRVYGMHMSSTGNYIYYSKNVDNAPEIPNLDANTFVRLNLSSGQVVRSGMDALIIQQTGLSIAQLQLFRDSQIESDGQGNIICTDGSKILKCTDPENGCNNWQLEQGIGGISLFPTTFNSSIVKKSHGSINPGFEYGLINISAPIYNNAVKPYWSGFEIDELIVANTSTWTGTSNPFQNKPVIYVKTKLEIAAGVRLNLQNITLRFAPEAKLIIREGTSSTVGAFLNMNNAKLEYDDRCEFAFWQGVQIHGNHDKNQEPYLRPQWQGLLIMNNNSEINNAHNGVKLIDPNNWARTGGVIRATNSKFINNRKAVEFMVYRNANNNSSSFRNTQFVVNDNYIPLQPGAITVRDFNAHVTLYDVKGVTFTACTFENNMTNKLGNSTTNNRGIGSLDAGYNIYGGQTGTTFYPTSFSGFIVGVDGGSTLTGRNLIIENANFTNNANGVKAVNNLQLSVTNSDFNIGTFNFDGVNKNTGIFTNRVSNLKIEQNNLLGSSRLNLERAGVETLRSGPNQNRIYKNAANNLNTAFFAQYSNRAPSDFVGLEYNCNLNSANFNYDFYALGTTDPLQFSNYEGIRKFQGNTPIGSPTTRVAAGNTFTLNASGFGHILNETQHAINYNYGSGNQQPFYYNNFVYPYPATNANLCPSNPYGPTNGGVVTQGKRLLIEQQYATYETEYLNLLYNLNQLIDNGSTTALLDEMQSSWSDHAWHFRNELLQISPYLSQDALREAINMEILPPAMILEICLANQEVSTSPEFIYWLETEAPVSLPNYMIVLLQQLVPDISPRTILQYQIAGYVSEMALIKNELLRYYLNDSLENTHTVAALIARNASEGELLTLVDYLAEKGLFTDALSQLNLMADMPNQNENFANLLVDYATYLNFRADLAADERNLAQLDSTELSFAIANANGNDPKIASRYRAFLCFLYEYCAFTDLETQGRKAQPKQVKNTKKALVKQDVRVFPNPATDAVSVYLENFSNLEGTIQLRMINAQGKTVLNEQVTEGTNIVNLNVAGKPAGIYMLEVWHVSERLFIEKLVIKN